MESSDRDRNRDERNLALNERLINLAWSDPNYLSEAKNILLDLQGSDSCTEYPGSLINKSFMMIEKGLAEEVKEIIKIWTEKYRRNYGLDLALERVLDSEDLQKTANKVRGEIIEILVQAGANLHTAEVRKELWQAFSKPELDLAEIKRLLNSLQEIGVFDFRLGFTLLGLFRRAALVEQAKEVGEIVKLFVEKQGEPVVNLNNYLSSILGDGDPFKEEKIRYEIFKALIEAGADINACAWSWAEGCEDYSPLEHALKGAKIQGGGRKVSLELVQYILKNGGHRFLVKALTSANSSEEARRQVPELFAIWDIVKEAKPDLQKTDFTNISKEQATEIEIIGGKIAQLYLYCKEEGITADEINNNKDWVLTFSPLDLKYLAAIKANAQFVLEDIKELTNNFVLEDKVTTFLKAEVNSPVDVELALSTKSL